VELLVTIAIIGILAWLLLPALAGAKVAAHNTVCRNNLRQLAISVAQYVTDHEYFPKNHFWKETKSESGFSVSAFDPTRWIESIQPYTKSKWTDGVYKCPAYRGETTYFTDPDPPSTVFGSYGYNAFASGANGLDDLTTHLWLKESEVVNPADMVEFGDANISVYYHMGITGVSVWA
jgi:type II secretory pathway pseudopilin PulG